MSKKIIYGEDSREALIKGINAVGDAVRVTLGPKGRNVVIDKEYGTPQIINDGISIAKEVELDDSIENMGAKLIINMAEKANDEVGDGSTSTIILAQAMVNSGMSAIQEGCNAVAIKNGMLNAAHDICKNLSDMAVPVDTSERIAQVASLSAGNDDEVGKLIAEAMGKVGKEGVITVGESKSFETELEVTEGMQFNRGFISPYFATDSEKGEAVYENPYILCANRTLGGIQELMPILEQVAKSGSPLLIIADDIEGEALATLTINNMRKLIKVVAVKAPDYGVNRVEILKDIAMLTGGKCAINELDQKLENFTLDDLGVAEKIVVTKDHTTIIVHNDTPEFKSYVKVLEAKIEVEENQYEQMKLKERLGKLTNGVAVIKVGALTEVEMKERKLRVEDALNATKAAVNEGVVAGGGTALVRAQMCTPRNIKKTSKDDTAIGEGIVFSSLTTPINLITSNAGVDSKKILEEVQNAKSDTFGYNALTGTFESDMIKAGIIDPVKVTKTALLNATSLAGMLLTAEVAIAKVPKKNDVANKLQGLM